MSNLKNSLIEVRKAYRLLYDYQKKILDLVNFIGSEYGRSYNGGYSKYCNTSPRNGKGHLTNWAWDWLNMYYYEFNFHNENDKSYFSVILLSDTGFYQAKEEDSSFKDKLNINKYKSPENSETKLYFVLGQNMWDCEGFLKNGCWEDSNFILQESGVSERNDKSGKMIFKSYNLDRFNSIENTLLILKDFSSFCLSNNLDFKLKKETESI